MAAGAHSFFTAKIIILWKVVGTNRKAALTAINKLSAVVHPPTFCASFNIGVFVDKTQEDIYVRIYSGIVHECYSPLLFRRDILSIFRKCPLGMDIEINRKGFTRGASLPSYHESSGGDTTGRFFIDTISKELYFYTGEIHKLSVGDHVLAVLSYSGKYGLLICSGGIYNMSCHMDTYGPKFEIEFRCYRQEGRYSLSRYREVCLRTQNTLRIRLGGKSKNLELEEVGLEDITKRAVDNISSKIETTRDPFDSEKVKIPVCSERDELVHFYAGIAQVKELTEYYVFLHIGLGSTSILYSLSIRDGELTVYAHKLKGRQDVAEYMSNYSYDVISQASYSRMDYSPAYGQVH